MVDDAPSFSTEMQEQSEVLYGGDDTNIGSLIHQFTKWLNA